MKKLLIFLVLALLVYPVKGIAEDRIDVKLNIPAFKGLDLKITLFQSIEKVKVHIEKNNLKFEGMYLHSVTLIYIEGHPKKGLCWHYAWDYIKPQMGGQISIFHYLDGTIKVFNHGP